MKSTKKSPAVVPCWRQSTATCKDENIPVGEKTLRRWVKEGKVPAVYTGRKALVSWANLMDFLTVGGE